MTTTMDRMMLAAWTEELDAMAARLAPLRDLIPMRRPSADSATRALRRFWAVRLSFWWRLWLAATQLQFAGEPSTAH